MLVRQANAALGSADRSLTAQIGDPEAALEAACALPEDENPDPSMLSLREMPTVTVDGVTYVGYLYVPALDLSLPVQSTCSMDALEISPCRYAGSIYSDDLVIAGHNYRRHFSPLRYLPAGSEIDFVDVEGSCTVYELSYVEDLQPDEVDHLKEKSEDYDLTLFTCQIGGRSRYTMRCKRTE